MTLSAVDRHRTKLTRAARAEEILAAARRVFAAKGFRGTTIADIADEAGIALGTIYLYFPSKEAVFAALNQQLADLISDAIVGDGATPEGSLDQTVRARVRRVFAACAENRDLVRLVVLNTDPGSETTKRMRKASRSRSKPMADGLRRAMDAGAIRSGDPDIIVKLMNGLVSFGVYDVFVLNNGEDAEAYCEACADMLVAYLRPER